jgi:tRNA A-37 threonylcarbamoyl transferase component Bud32
LIAAGHTIGSYRILNKIGTGGMGAVYLAEHPLIGKKVALKVIHRELAGNREVVQRFFQEARAVTKIGNEHIVEIHDFGVTPEGDHFYIMEYLEGHTLATVLGRERVLEIMRALHIGAQVASALAAAHVSGVIHRDLKPDNVMLTMRLGDRDFVKLLDFGLAKMFQGGGASAVKTAAGVLLGTPQYMSPEACESRATIDHRTDIYALGILLFQMMTGVLPFDGETMGEVLVKQVTQLPPPPRGFNPNIPPSVEQIVLRCLAKAPDARFATMALLREALLDPEGYLQASPPMVPARSIRPGEAPVDAKGLKAFVDQQQKTRLGMQGAASGGLPLPAPANSLSGNAQAATMMVDASQVPKRAAAVAGPDMAAPMQPKMNTMRIATPLGYSSRPPRKMWPIVLVLGLLLGLGGGAFAVAWFGRQEAKGTGGSGTASDAKVVPGSASGSGTVKGTGTGTGSGTTTGSGTVTTTGSGTGSGTAASGSGTGPASGSAVGPMAVVVIDSVPQGAELFGADKKSLGKTPVRLSLPISDTPIDFELRLGGYRRKPKQVTVTGNTVIQIPLERAPAAVPHHPSGSGSSHSGSPDELMPTDY